MNRAPSVAGVLTREIPRLVVDTIALPDWEGSIGDALAAVAGTRRPLWLWSTPDGDAEIGIGAAARIAGDRQTALTATRGRGAVVVAADGGDDRFRQVDALLAALWERAGDAASEMIAVGGSAFAHGGHMRGEWRYFPRIAFTVPAFRLQIRAARATLTTTRIDGCEPLGRERLLDDLSRTHERDCRTEPTRFTVSATHSRSHWNAMLATALAGIDAGEVDKIVLARSVVVEADRPFETVALIDELRNRNPYATVFALDDVGGTFVGATPEVLLRWRDGAAESTPLAGTVAAGAELPVTERDKVEREHGFARAHVLDVFRRTCSGVRAEVPRELGFGAVAHLGSRISGTPDAGSTPLGLAGTLHPTPAIGAVPVSAAGLIPALEGFERGWYAGFVGRVGPHTAAVARALRCGLLRGRRATLYAGCGVVAGSDADAEFEESRLKLGPMLDALVMP